MNLGPIDKNKSFTNLTLKANLEFDMQFHRYSLLFIWPGKSKSIDHSEFLRMKTAKTQIPLDPDK